MVSLDDSGVVHVPIILLVSHLRNNATLSVPLGLVEGRSRVVLYDPTFRLVFRLLAGPDRAGAVANASAALVEPAAAALRSHRTRDADRPAGPRTEETALDEADMATQAEEAAAEARLPGPDEHTGRPTGHQQASRQGPRQAGRLALVPGPLRPGIDATDRSEVLSRIGKPATINRTRDFDGVFRRGKRHRGRFMTLVCLWRPEGELRVAFAAGKLVGSAVARNRQRRRLREAFRGLWPAMAHHAADVVFLAQPSAADADFAALKTEMAKLLQRAGVTAVGKGRGRSASG